MPDFPCAVKLPAARSLAPALVSGQLEFLWIYLLGPCLGSLLAVGTWTLVNKGPSQLAK